ncbi:MAG: DUF1622 domain-containing protein [Dehalococcoidia bacterium]|nr:DUF1622 domain-containing protein [Dehalococcoidia bacterium]
MIAADIINPAIEPALKEAGILTVIVAICATVFFLTARCIASANNSGRARPCLNVLSL